MAQTKKEINKQDTLKRVLAYVLKNYKWRFLLSIGFDFSNSALYGTL